MQLAIGNDGDMARVPDECERCSAFSACHGGCRADAVLKGVKRDPLMTIPLQAIEIAPPQPKIEPLSLYGQAIPHLEYKLTDTHFGPVLVKGSDIIPLSPRARPILAAIEQPLTLRQLEHTFGNQSLELIGELYRQNALSLRVPL